MTNPLVDPAESSVRWWERDPVINELWITLEAISILANSKALDSLTDTEHCALSTLVCSTVRELESLC